MFRGCFDLTEDVLNWGRPKSTSQGRLSSTFRGRLKDVMGEMFLVPQFIFFTELNALLKDVLKAHSSI